MRRLGKTGLCGGHGWLTVPAEYFQWRPQHNENSQQATVKAGDILFGSVLFNENEQVRVGGLVGVARIGCAIR